MTFARSDRDPESGGSPSQARGREASQPRGHVLVIDDEENARWALERALRDDGFLVSAASDGVNALAEAQRALPDVVLTDLQMPRMDGVTLCQSLHAIDPDLPVIFATASSEMQSVVASLRAGAEDYLVKPLEYDAVVWSLERAIARRAEKVAQERLRRENQELYRALNERLVLSSIREHEHAETEALRRAQLSALLENLAEGVVIADRAGGIVMFNEAARAILGTDGEPRTIDELQSLEAYDLGGRSLCSEERPVSRALRGERFADYEVVRVRADGDRRQLVSTGTSVKDENGNIVLAIVTFRDVTELRRLEQHRDEFLALTSHDLRNPLGIILMLVGTLKRYVVETSGTPVDQHAIVGLAERVERNVRRMNAMIEELTEATNFESHAVTLRCIPCDLRELIANVVDNLDDPRAQRVKIEADDPSPCVVFAEASKLERVIANLLTNALKYSDDDTPVTVRLSRGARDIELAVSDRGIGISPGSVKRIFDRYYRTTGGKARASGLGLGLYIAQLIVEAHGGRIDVSSEVGKGSTFTLTLPSIAVPS
jgi:PAS domain S-box-containing protein